MIDLNFFQDYASNIDPYFCLEYLYASTIDVYLALAVIWIKFYLAVFYPVCDDDDDDDDIE